MTVTGTRPPSRFHGSINEPVRLRLRDRVEIDRCRAADFAVADDGDLRLGHADRQQRTRAIREPRIEFGLADGRSAGDGGARDERALLRDDRDLARKRVGVLWRERGGSRQDGHAEDQRE